MHVTLHYQQKIHHVYNHTNMNYNNIYFHDNKNIKGMNILQYQHYQNHQNNQSNQSYTQMKKHRSHNKNKLHQNPQSFGNMNMNMNNYNMNHNKTTHIKLLNHTNHNNTYNNNHHHNNNGMIQNNITNNITHNNSMNMNNNIINHNKSNKVKITFKQPQHQTNHLRLINPQITQYSNFTYIINQHPKKPLNQHSTHDINFHQNHQQLNRRKKQIKNIFKKQNIFNSTSSTKANSREKSRQNSITSVQSKQICCQVINLHREEQWKQVQNGIKKKYNDNKNNKENNKNNKNNDKTHKTTNNNINNNTNNNNKHYDNAIISKQITKPTRIIMLDWLYQLCSQIQLPKPSLYNCISYIDKYISLNNIPKSQYQSIGLACLFLSTKLQSSSHPKITTFLSAIDNKISKPELIQYERKIVLSLKFKLNPPTLYQQMTLFIFMLKTFKQLYKNIRWVSQISQVKKNSQLERKIYWVLDGVMIDGEVVKKYQRDIICLTIMYLIMLEHKYNEIQYSLISNNNNMNNNNNNNMNNNNMNNNNNIDMNNNNNNNMNNNNNNNMNNNNNNNMNNIHNKCQYVVYNKQNIYNQINKQYRYYNVNNSLATTNNSITINTSITNSNTKSNMNYMNNMNNLSLINPSHQLHNNNEQIAINSPSTQTSSYQYNGHHNNQSQQLLLNKYKQMQQNFNMNYQCFMSYATTSNKSIKQLDSCVNEVKKWIGNMDKCKCINGINTNNNNNNSKNNNSNNSNTTYNNSINNKNSYFCTQYHQQLKYIAMMKH